MATTLLSVDRVRNGQPAQVELIASYKDTGEGLPVLTICRDWRPTLSRWAKETSYKCEEVPTWGGARAFVLHRSEECIARDVAKAKPGNPDVDTFYAVVLESSVSHNCTCRGYQSTAHTGVGRCCHVSALTALLGGGFIDRPCADRKPEPICQRCRQTTDDLFGALCGDCSQDLWDEEQAAEGAAEHDHLPNAERPADPVDAMTEAPF
jgi:hypothetical protein